MAQSCANIANIANDIILDLEKKLILYVKELHFIITPFLKRCIL
jgi:hypothetical protein